MSKVYANCTMLVLSIAVVTSEMKLVYYIFVPIKKLKNTRT